MYGTKYQCRVKDSRQRFLYCIPCVIENPKGPPLNLRPRLHLQGQSFMVLAQVVAQCHSRFPYLTISYLPISNFHFLWFGKLQAYLLWSFEIKYQGMQRCRFTHKVTIKECTVLIHLLTVEKNPRRTPLNLRPFI